MNRRGFLKNLFGAAVVTAMPKIVTDKLSELPPPEYAPTRLHEEDKVSALEKHISGNMLCIYDENHLIGWSNQFSLNVHRDMIDVTSSSGRWEKRVVGIKKNGRKKKRWFYIPATGYPEYILGLQRWDISANMIEWYVEPRDYFVNDKRMRCLVYSNTMKLEGEIILTQLDMNSSFKNPTFLSAKFEGSGTLIMESK